MARTRAKAWYKRNNYGVKGVYSPYAGYGGMKISIRQKLKRDFWKEYERAYGDQS